MRLSATERETITDQSQVGGFTYAASPRNRQFI